MRTNQEAGSDPMADAISALTTAARGRRTIGAGTPNEYTERADFGAIACQVITAVAANIGGAGELLSGRPGSWEADLIRQIVLSTAGDDDRQLLTYRTDPLRLVVDVEAEFGDMAVYDLYEEAVDELTRRVEEARDELTRTVATPAERARLAEIEAAFAEWGIAFEDDARRAQAFHLRDEWEAIFQSIDARAEQADDPIYAALIAADQADRRLSDLWEQDQQEYREAYARAVRSYLKIHDMHFPAEVVDVLSDDAAAALNEDQGYVVIELVDELHRHARKAAVLPMTGEAPDWTQGKPADALRRAGLTYLEAASD